MFGLQKRAKIGDALRFRDIQSMILDRSQPAITGQRLRFLQLLIILQDFDRFFASALVASGKVDEKGTVVES